MRVKEKLIYFIRSEIVLMVAGVAAILSACFVHPSLDYINYLDFKVLILLFCLMAIIAGITKIGVLRVLSQKLMERATSTKAVSLSLVMLCFFSSMFLTNDVALLTFVPFAIAVLGREDRRRLIFVVTMQTVAANLGSMLMPIGNPQNLYLYSKYNFSIGEFFKITAPITAISLVLIVAMMALEKSGTIQISFPQKELIQDKKRLLIDIVLFLLCLLTVIGILDEKLLLVVVCLTIFISDKKLFGKVDYSLLCTFVFFFIFVGNMGRITEIREFFSQLMKGRELIVSVFVSQIISNVPAAVMLSGFTDHGAALVAGTNIGGLGTLVASLASLISFKLYAKSENANTKEYLGTFTLINLILLMLLLTFAILVYVF